MHASLVLKTESGKCAKFGFVDYYYYLSVIVYSVTVLVFCVHKLDGCNIRIGPVNIVCIYIGFRCGVALSVQKWRPAVSSYKTVQWVCCLAEQVGDMVS